MALIMTTATTNTSGITLSNYDISQQLKEALHHDMFFGSNNASVSNSAGLYQWIEDKVQEPIDWLEESLSRVRLRAWR